MGSVEVPQAGAGGELGYHGGGAFAGMPQDIAAALVITHIDAHDAAGGIAPIPLFVGAGAAPID